MHLLTWRRKIDILSPVAAARDDIRAMGVGGTAMGLEDPAREARASTPGDDADLRQSDLSRGTNQAGVRLYNERLILSLVRRHHALSKVDIARLTGLSAQTTTVIVKRLEADGLLAKQEPKRGRVGQPAVPFALDPDGAFALGLKIGRKSTDLVLIDFCAKIRAKLSLPHPYPTPAAVLEFVENGVARCLDLLTPAQAARVAGLGVAAPFELWNWQKEVGAPRKILDQWRHFDTQREIAARAPMPVYVCNDASSACAAELFFGEGWRRRDFLYVFIGAFIGGGLVLDGDLFLGRRGNAGAIGSMPVMRAGLKGAVSRQQLIRGASIFSLEHKLRGGGCDVSILWRTPSDWGDLGPRLDEWIEDAAGDLAQTIVSANAIVDIEAAVIDGAMPAGVRQRIVEATARRIQELDLQGLFPVAVLGGGMGPDARALGAAALPFLAHFARDREVLFRGAMQGDADHAQGN